MLLSSSRPAAFVLVSELSFTASEKSGLFMGSGNLLGVSSGPSGGGEEEDEIEVDGQERVSVAGGEAIVVLAPSVWTSSSRP